MSDEGPNRSLAETHHALSIFAQDKLLSLLVVLSVR